MLKIVDSSAITNLTLFGVSRQISGRHFHQTARYAMRLWVSFALNKIAAAEPGKIRAALSRVVTGYTVMATASIGARTSLKNRKTKRFRPADQWRGTIASKIVAMLNYRNARTAPRSDFYRIVGKFVRGRMAGARIHRAGMGPAMDATADVGRVRREGRKLPKYRKPPGSYEQKLKADTADILVENFASAFGSRAKGIVGIAPEAFNSSAAEVDRLLGLYAERNLREAAIATGFTARAA